MYVCIDGWVAAGGGLSRDKGRIGRDGIIVVGRIGIGRTYPRRMIMIIISGCRACAQWCSSSSSSSSGGSTAQAKASALIRKREMICNGKTRLGLAKGKEGKLDAAPTWDDWS